MDPVSVGLFIVGAVVIVLIAWELLDLRRAIRALNHRLIPEALAKLNAPDARVTALELENRTIKADIAEIRAARRAELERTRQSRPGSFRAFRNDLRGAEIEQP